MPLPLPNLIKGETILIAHAWAIQTTYSDMTIKVVQVWVLADAICNARVYYLLHLNLSLSRVHITNLQSGIAALSQRDDPQPVLGQSSSDEDEDEEEGGDQYDDSRSLHRAESTSSIRKDKPWHKKDSGSSQGNNDSYIFD